MLSPRKLWQATLCIALVACGDEAEWSEPAAMKVGPSDGASGDGSRPDGSLGVVTDAGLPVRTASWCEVKTVLAQHCTACHKSGGVGPFPLGTYEDLMRESPTFPGLKIYQRVGARMHDKKQPMPPSGVVNDAALSKVDSWIAGGARNDLRCPEFAGPVTDAAPWPEHCDATYRILAHAPTDTKAPYQVAAGLEIHPKITVDAPWGDEEVQAIAFRPITDNEKVLHHWILYASDQTFLNGWAPGKDEGDALPSDVGMYMPRGARSMFLDMHYYNREGTSPEYDRSGVEICTLKKPSFRPNIASVFRGFNSTGGSDAVLAPAVTQNHTEEGVCHVQTSKPVRLLTSSAHAHTYAVHMKFTVQKADGREIVMHDEDFAFEAQESRALEEPVTIETGDIVRTACTYDNDSARNIRFGENTVDEMCFNFAVYYPMGALSCRGGLLR
jgi:hypothetical protein